MPPLRIASLLLAAAASCAMMAPSARAISMRGDAANVNSTGNDNPYVALGSTFNAVAFIQWTTPSGSFTGTGTLVNSSTPGQFKFLTAAHNVDSEGPAGANANKPDGVIDAPNFTVYFGPRTSADGSTSTAHVTVPAASISVQPRWAAGDGTLTKGAAQYDLAVFTFTLGMVVTPAGLPTPMGFSLANPAGQTGTMVGHGSFGTGNNFANNAADGVRRAGQNTIDAFGPQPDDAANTGFSIQTDFDSPTDSTKSTLGTATALTLESSTAGGDSGGPLLVSVGGQSLIVGVLNGGFNPTTNGKVSEYGDRSIWASIAQSNNQAFLTGAGIAVPEPSTVAATALGLALLGGHLRRRRASVC